MIVLEKSDKYCGKCYHGDECYPFSFCKECWIKAGKPKRMDGTTNPRRREE